MMFRKINATLVWWRTPSYELDFAQCAWILAVGGVCHSYGTGCPDFDSQRERHRVTRATQRPITSIHG